METWWLLLMGLVMGWELSQPQGSDTQWLKHDYRRLRNQVLHSRERR